MSSVSVIIPTFKRPLGVVAHTIRSILEDQKSLESIERIIVIDQNPEPLGLGSESFPIPCAQVHARDCPKFEGTGKQVIHIFGLSPSVTRAKNLGCTLAKGELLVFFDDDITVQAGCVTAYVECFQENGEVGFLGGREILDSKLSSDPAWKRIIRKWMQADPRKDAEYRFDGRYVGRIQPNSIMLKDFNVPADRLIRIDGARGCNWACRRSWFEKSGGFDEHFQGNALREETDLYIRLGRQGARGYYLAKAVVIHHRQPGGCDNLKQSIASLRSKLANDFYFQQKHFKCVPRFYFMARTFPLVLETLRETRGQSLWAWLAYWFKSR